MSDSENIFGAEANIIAIVDGIDASSTYYSSHPKSSRERYFSTFKEASAWLKKNTDFLVTPHDGGFIARLIDPHARFVLNIDPDVLGDCDSYAGYQASQDLGGDTATIESVTRFIALMTGELTTIRFDRQPPPLSEVKASLLKIHMELYPLTPQICLIENFNINPGQIDGALITENFSTSLVAPARLAARIYRAIMGI